MAKFSHPLSWPLTSGLQQALNRVMDALWSQVDSRRGSLAARVWQACQAEFPSLIFGAYFDVDHDRAAGGGRDWKSIDRLRTTIEADLDALDALTKFQKQARSLGGHPIAWPAVDGPPQRRQEPAPAYALLTYHTIAAEAIRTFQEVPRRDRSPSAWTCLDTCLFCWRYGRAHGSNHYCALHRPSPSNAHYKAGKRSYAKVVNEHSRLHCDLRFQYPAQLSFDDPGSAKFVGLLSGEFVPLKAFERWRLALPNCLGRLPHVLSLLASANVMSRSAIAIQRALDPIDPQSSIQHRRIHLVQARDQRFLWVMLVRAEAWLKVWELQRPSRLSAKCSTANE